MKKLLLAVFCFSGLASSAQNGLYLQPAIGFGNSGVLAHDNLKLGTYENESRAGVSVYNAELGVGYRLNHWEISSGIFFLQSGYYEHTVSGYQFLIDTKTTQYYSHIALPIIAGYGFRLGKRICMAPVLVTKYLIIIPTIKRLTKTAIQQNKACGGVRLPHSTIAQAFGRLPV